MTTARILDTVLGKPRLTSARIVYSAVRRVQMPERGYPCTVTITEQRWRRPRAFLAAPVIRYTAMVKHDEPVPLAAWTGRTVKWSVPDVSAATDPEHAANLALHAVRNDIMRQRRGDRVQGLRKAGV